MFAAQLDEARQRPRLPVAWKQEGEAKWVAHAKGKSDRVGAVLHLSDGYSAVIGEGTGGRIGANRTYKTLRNAQRAIEKHAPRAARESLFDLPPPVMEWVELVERREGQGALAKLLFGMEAFIEKVSPEVRKGAEAEGTVKSWWPAVSVATKLAFQGRKLGLTDTRSAGPRYNGKFDSGLFVRMLKKIRSESDHDELRRIASKALSVAPA